MLFSDDETVRRNATIIKVCCRNRRDCLHRQALELCKTASDGSSMSISLDHGRDIWNETLLHMVARWSVQDLSHQLITLLQRCDASIVNARNIDGDTFLHILARRWVDLGESPGWRSPRFASIVKEAGLKGFDFTACNTAGFSVLAGLIPAAEKLTEFDVATPDPVRRVVSTLWCLLVDIRRQLFLKSSGSLAQAFLRQQSFVHAIHAFFSTLSCWRDQLSRTDGLQELVALLEKEYADLRERALAESLPAPSAPPSLHSYIENLSAMAVSKELFLGLLRSGVDPNEYNADGKTCLMALIEQVRSVETASELPMVLLCQGATLSLLDREGNTALHYAVRNRLPDVVKQLILAGVDVHARNVHNETAPEMAVEQLARSARPEGKEYASSQAMLVRFVDEKVLRRKQQRQPTFGANIGV